MGVCGIGRCRLSRFIAAGITTTKHIWIAWLIEMQATGILCAVWTKKSRRMIESLKLNGMQRRLARAVLKCCITGLKTWENISPRGLIGLKPLKNRFGQSVQSGEANFTSLYRFAGLLFPRLRCIMLSKVRFRVGKICSIYYREHSKRSA